MSCASLGLRSVFLVEAKADVNGADSTFDSGSEIYPFMYESIGSDRRLIGTNNIYGTRSQYADRLKKEAYIPQGFIGFQPSPLELSFWLPRILGTGATNPFEPAEALPAIDAIIGRDAGAFFYKNGFVNQAIFRGRSGPGEASIISMALQLIFWDEYATTLPDPMPPLGILAPNHANTIQRSPYIFDEGVLSISGTEYLFDAFTLVINNNLIVRHRNSKGPKCITPGPRSVMLEFQQPYLSANRTMNNTLYNTGSAAYLQFTNGTVSTKFEFLNIRSNLRTPNAMGRGEIPQSIRAIATRTDSTTMEIKVTNDSTV